MSPQIYSEDMRHPVRHLETVFNSSPSQSAVLKMASCTEQNVRSLIFFFDAYKRSRKEVPRLYTNPVAPRNQFFLIKEILASSPKFTLRFRYRSVCRALPAWNSQSVASRLPAKLL